jgi:broad specificity phosphatase PhoE
LVVSSPLLRTRQTAALAFQGSAITSININPLIAEKVDSWSDVTRGEMGLEPLDEEDVPELSRFEWHLSRSRYCKNLPSRVSLGPGYPFESLENVKNRIKLTWKWLADRSEDRIVLFTHYKFLGCKGRDYGLVDFLGLNAMANASMLELKFAPHGWKELDPLLVAPLGGAGMVSAGAGVCVYMVCGSLGEAREEAGYAHKVLIQEEEPFHLLSGSDEEGGDTVYVVMNADCHGAIRQCRLLPSSPERMPVKIHVAPIDVCVGIACMESVIYHERISHCVAVMQKYPCIRTLVWSETDKSQRCHGSPGLSFFESLGRACAAVEYDLCGALSGAMRVIVDGRARSTLGNARYALERIVSDAAGLECHVRVHLVTSPYHMERARLAFERACAALLVPGGHNFEVVCHGCEHSRAALGESGGGGAERGARRRELEEQQRERNRLVSDDEVRNWE